MHPVFTMRISSLYRKSRARIFSFVFIGVVLSAFPLCAFAADLGVTPVVVDDKAKARDILKRSITIQNTSNRKLNLYPSVNDVHPEDGKAPFVSAQSADDRADSLANWIELARGVVELGPGEERTLPFVVRVSPNAVPGTYHAMITLGEGGDRGSAEASTPLANVTVNVEVQEDSKEFLQLNTFKTDTLFFSGDDVLFNYQLENIGNQALQPKGEVRIYNRKGEEVASIQVNPDGKTFGPDQQIQLASVWSAASGFGKYKAFLNIDYGANQPASVQDTVFFWIVPWQQLIGMIIASLIAVIFLALYFHRWLEEKHHQKFARAHGIDPTNPIAQEAIADIPRESLMRRAGSLFAAVGSLVRRKKNEETPARLALVAPMLSAIETPKPVSQEVVTAPAIQRAENNVIDLKNRKSTHSLPSEAPQHGQVINLKKRP